MLVPVREVIRANPNMMDITSLPKNANGFRTTHTCELCGFEPKTKNKYREKQDHLVMKHFKDRIDKIFPHSRPYSCPNPECDFTGKDKQALLRHYTGKHGVLELYLREALAEKGIQYQLSDSAKRKSMGQPADHQRKAKEARLSPPLAITSIQLPPPPPTTTTVPMSQNVVTNERVMADTTTPMGNDLPDLMYTGEYFTNTRLPTVPTNKLPSMSTVLTRPLNSNGKCDVDALLASFQPIDTQLLLNIPSPAGGGPAELPLDSPLVSSTTPDIFSMPPEEPSKVVLNDNVMWSGGSLAVPASEAAQTVPTAAYLESSDIGFINVCDVPYDFLYPSSMEPAPTTQHTTSLANTISNQERQLSFSML